MRKIVVSILTMLFALLFTLQGISQKKQMTWTTTSEVASGLAHQGADHMMNAEFEQAYADFNAALKLDPNFTVALVFMSNLARGDVRKSYAERALKSASDKTEGEKLFASLADDKNKQEERRVIWAKLHSMFPEGAMLADFYVQTRATPEERFTAAEDFIKKFPDNAAMYNTIAYYYMLDKKDNSMAKTNLDKYVALYPEGTNPYDSMGEYYLTIGDKENAKKYYTMALEKFPFNNSSLNALQKMADVMKTADTK
ncbi:MAG: hypothetical protein ABJA90_10985 [Ginsengibacter sp.]